MLVNERKWKVNEYTKRIVLFGPISIDILFFFFFFFLFLKYSNLTVCHPSTFTRLTDFFSRPDTN